MFASKISIFSAHKDTSGLKNSKLSQTSHMNMWRSIDHIPGKDTYTKPETDTPFTFNPPMDNQGFVEGCYFEKGFV